MSLTHLNFLANLVFEIDFHLHVLSVFYKLFVKFSIEIDFIILSVFCYLFNFRYLLTFFKDENGCA